MTLVLHESEPCLLQPLRRLLYLIRRVLIMCYPLPGPLDLLSCGIKKHGEVLASMDENFKSSLKAFADPMVAAGPSAPFSVSQGYLSAGC